MTKFRKKIIQNYEHFNECFKVIIYETLIHAKLSKHDEVEFPSGLDASICQQDCTKYEESDFAKKCKKDKGYFKCCVRNNSLLIFMVNLDNLVFF